MTRLDSTTVAAIALIAIALAGCEASTARRPARAAALVEPLEGPDTLAVAPREDGAAPSGAARLRRTITLGSSYGNGTSRSASIGRRAMPTAPAPVPSPPNVYVLQAPYGGYGGYGGGAPGWYGGYGGYGAYGCCGWAGPGFIDRDARDAKRRPSPEHPPALGEDWSPPPSYGPRFPFKTAPADPWR